MKNCQRSIIWIVAVCLLITFSSCDPYSKLLKSDDYELKLAEAKRYYNEGKFSKSIPLLEELLGVYKGKSNVDKLYYYYAYSHFGNKDYTLSSYYFDNFTSIYKKSKYREDAQFMIAKSYHKMSSPVLLEQTNTQKAIDKYQLFINAYPHSDRAIEAQENIDNLRAKLEAKAYESANLYYRMRNYQAAATAYKNLLNRFPDTKQKETILFETLRSYYLLALNSVQDKQKDRFEKSIDAYLNFIDAYPQSSMLREAERMYITSKNKLDTFNKSQANNN